MRRRSTSQGNYGLVMAHSDVYSRTGGGGGGGLDGGGGGLRTATGGGLFFGGGALVHTRLLTFLHVLTGCPFFLTVVQTLTETVLQTIGGGGAANASTLPGQAAA